MKYALFSRLASEGKLMPERDSRLRTIQATMKQLMNRIEVILFIIVFINSK